MRAEVPLSRRILRWLLGYAVAVSAVVAGAGYIIHERVERLAWESLLRAELDYLGERRQSRPGYQWRDTEKLRLLGAPGTRAMPPSLAALPDGLHHDQMVDGVHSVVLRDQVDGQPVAMALDLTEFDSAEGAVTLAAAGGTIVLILLLGMLVMWRLGRAVAPLTDVARQVARLQPGEGGRGVLVAPHAGVELDVIAEAFNEYHDRTRAYVERERTFIATASHELRTPISVIGGAADLLLAQKDLPGSATAQATRIAQMAAGMEELLTLLLMLARDPRRLEEMSEVIALDHLLPQIVEDHRHLTITKALSLRMERSDPCEILAPPGIVQSAIGNLLRNAIEHSDSGEISITLLADATLVIEDPGHGMSPEQISEIYGRLARGGGERSLTGSSYGSGSGIGIGIDLISRLCNHLGWRLEFDSTPGSGTATTLHFKVLGSAAGADLR